MGRFPSSIVQVGNTGRFTLTPRFDMFGVVASLCHLSSPHEFLNSTLNLCAL